MALAELYPNGSGPSVSEVVADGWLVPSIDRQRLRLPPLVAESPQRLQFLPSTSANGNPHERQALPGFYQRVAVKPNALLLQSKFSYFEGPITNTTPQAAITLPELFRVITSPPSSLRERARAARVEYEANGKSQWYQRLKLRLDNFSVGGTFTQRKDAALIKASGLLVLDFDGMGNRVADARTELLADTHLIESLALLFVSPSGDGLKVVLMADPNHDRRENYRRLDQYLTRRYGWGPTLDKSTTDLSRACFLSHDPNAWLAPAFAASSSLTVSPVIPYETP
jgi:hypothetical protein